MGAFPGIPVTTLTGGEAVILYSEAGGQMSEESLLSRKLTAQS